MRKNYIGYALLLVIFALTQMRGNLVSARKNTQTLYDKFLYLPLALKNYPLITVFGIASSTNFDLVGQAGVTWAHINTELLWNQVQPDSPNTWNWSNSNVQAVESQILAARSQGLTVLLFVSGTPEWAMKANYAYKACGPIDRNYFDEFGVFLKKVVERYSVEPYGVKYFSIWNEPDAGYQITPGSQGYGCWGEDSLSYYGGEYFGDMLSVVYPFMKSANPGVNVVSGSLLLYCDPRWIKWGACPDKATQKSSTFFEGVIRKAANAIDAVAYNGQVSYSSGNNPVYNEKNNWRWAASGGLMDGKINYLQSTMAKYGVTKPIMLTEGGLVDGDGSDAFEQAKSDYMVYMNANGWFKGLLAVDWYTMKGWKGSELIDTNNQPKPVYNALKTMTGFLKEAQYSKREEYAGFSKFVFILGSQEIWLLTPTGQSSSASYNLAKPTNFVKLVDIYGVEQADPGSTITFSRPVYIFRNR